MIFLLPFYRYQGIRRYWKTKLRGKVSIIPIDTVYLSSQANQLLVYDWNGNLKTGFPYHFSSHYPINYSDAKLYFKDINNDGKLEIIIPYMQKTNGGEDTNTFELLVIDSNGQKDSASFTKTILASSQTYIMNHQLLFTDYDNDGKEDIVVFQLVYNSFSPVSLSHLQATAYNTSGVELASKTHAINQLSTAYYYLYDAFPITHQDSGHTKHYALFSAPGIGAYPGHALLFDDDLDLVAIHQSSYFTNKYAYKSFDIDADGYTDLGYINHDPEASYTQLHILKNNLTELVAINLPLPAYTPADFEFMIGNVLGDEQNEIVVANVKYLTSEYGSTDYYNTYSRKCWIYDVNGVLLDSQILGDKERFFSLADVDNDDYDEMIFTPAFYFDKLSILNGDFSVVQELQLTSMLSGINQMPAITTRLFPYIAKIEQDESYQLFFNNRKLNIVDLGITESSKIRWFHGYGTNQNDFGMNQAASEGTLQVTLTSPFSLADLHGKTVTATGDVLATSTAFDYNTGFVLLENLRFGTYTLQTAASTYWHTYSGSQQVVFAYNEQSVNLSIERLVQPNRSTIYVKIGSDSAFDNIGVLGNIFSVRNLQTGAVVNTSVPRVLITNGYVEYHANLSGMPADTDFEVSLEVETNGYRYTIDTVTLRTRTDYFYNEITSQLHRQAF